MSYIPNFIHLYFFTEFEIFFYIYYILPYEKELVYNMFDINKLLAKFDDDVVITLINNISNTNLFLNDKHCDSEQERIDNSNNKLWTYCFIYIISINSILCLLFVYDLILNYRLYNETKEHKIIKQNNDKKFDSKSILTAFGSGNNLDLNYKKTDNISSFEIDMIDLEINTNVGDVGISTSPLNNMVKGITNNSFCIYYWNKSVLVIAISNTLKFILFIGVFEYLFFVFIINKFKIVNSELLLCKLLKEI
jgi:hypothetical protein